MHRHRTQRPPVRIIVKGITYAMAMVAANRPHLIDDSNGNLLHQYPLFTLRLSVLCQAMRLAVNQGFSQVNGAGHRIVIIRFYPSKS